MKAASRSGFAVATAVFALVVIGALAMGTLFAGTHEHRSGPQAIQQTRAVMAAELGIEHTIAAWNRRWNGTLGRGFGVRSTVSTEGAAVEVHIARLTDELFVVTSEAHAGPARRRVARVVRLHSAEPSVLAPLAASVDLSALAMGVVDPTDRSPPGWDCPAPGAQLSPSVVADTSTLLRFGRFDWGELVRSANARPTAYVLGVAPLSTEEECDTASPQNWGEPMRSNGGACTSYYPIIHAAGDLTIDGGRGQGLLIVDGNLTIRGGFDFYGAILVRGAVLGGPGGGRLTGVMSMALQGPTTPVLDGITIAFSRCAARKALLGLALPVPLEERSWYDAFSNR